MDLDAILYRLKELEKKASEVDFLKSQIAELKSLNSLGQDIAQEETNKLIDEVNLLKENDVNIPFLDKKIEDLTFTKRKTRKPLTEAEILDAQSKSPSARNTAKRLGVTYVTYKKYCDLYGISNIRQKKQKLPTLPCNPFKGKYPIQKILNGEFPDFSIHRLKDKLIRSGIKKAECEQCGFKERRITDGKLPLLICFEDGNTKNHMLENLKIRCYNCTFLCGRGYLKKGIIGINLDPDVMQGATLPQKARF